LKAETVGNPSIPKSAGSKNDLPKRVQSNHDQIMPMREHTPLWDALNRQHG
jgi:hypothetical protein